jgi:hypothetical protein
VELMTSVFPVKLRHAYCWYCAVCGRRNYGEPSIAELSPAERLEFISEGLDPTTGNWTTMPEAVTCAGCETEYPTESPDEPA